MNQGTPNGRKPNPIARFAVENRVTMAMAVIGVLVMGALSLQRLPLEFLPAFSSSSITVEATYRSSAPEEVQRLIVQPLEDILGDISGIETMSARAGSDSGRVSLRFVDGTDMEMAAVEVRDRVDRVRGRLPDDVDRVSIRRFQSTDIPVLAFTMSSERPREWAYEFAELVVQRRLERIEGVAQVEVRGLLTPRVQIDLDPDRMAAYSVNVRDVVSLIRDENRNIAGGEIDEGGRKLLVRSVGEFSTLDEIRDLPLNGQGLRLSDVADVSYSFPRQESFNYLNGVEALTLSVDKVSSANLLSVVDAVKAELDVIGKLPDAASTRFRIYHDASVDVRKGLGQLRDAGLFGAGLAVLAVFVFLRRFRTTALIAIAIPVSVVGTFVTMYLLRQAGLSEVTLNVVSLAGLMLALGMLVDNSIVVIESIFRHRNELQHDAKTAAILGTTDVALPITAATATTLCVFLPVIFMNSGGRMQIYFTAIGTTVSIVIAVSLVVALTVVPSIAAVAMRNQAPRSSRFVDWLTRGYARVLRFTLKHRLAFVVLIVGLLWGSTELFKTIERSFGSRTEERQVTVNVDVAQQFSVDETAALFDELYGIFNENREALDIADISYSYNRGTGRSRGRNRRRIELYLVDEEQSSLTTAEARDKARALLPVRPGVEMRIAQGRGRHGSAGVEVELSGDDPAVLEMLSGRLVQQLRTLPMIRDVDTSLESGDEEIWVRPGRERALQSGVSTQLVASTVSNALSSRAVSWFDNGDREVEIIVQYREDERETLDQLRNVPVRNAESAVPLGALAEFEFRRGPKSIDRENRQATVSITANATSRSGTFAAMGLIRRSMGEFSMPPGYSWSFGRWSRIQAQDAETGWFAIGFAVLLVYLLMAALFESFAQPFTIMFSVPFALLGVAVAMKLAGQPLDTTSNIGLIILLGVVVNNAIVLIDHINQLRNDGMERNAAIVKGGQNRLRPILITAVTTLLGLFPLVAPILLPQWFGPVEGRAGTWAPIGLVIMGGLTTSTFLTLIIIPTLYSLIDDISGFGGRVLSAVRRTPVAAVESGE